MIMEEPQLNIITGITNKKTKKEVPIMEWTEILTTIITTCIIPILGILTTYFVKFINSKIDSVKEKTKSDTVDKYLTYLQEIVANCVNTTTQTYVGALKDKNMFDAEAQKAAFKLTYNAVMNNLTEEGKKILGEVTNDLPAFITEMIESKIAQNK